MGPVVGSLLGVPHLSSRFRPRSRSRDSSRLSESDAHAHAQSWFCLGVSDTDRLRLQRTRTRTRSYFHCELRPVVVVCTEGTPCSQRGRTLTLTVTLILILEPPVSGARLHWGRNHCANINIHIYICAVFGHKCVELPL